ncbi:MAG: sodium-translocating pyrophosphatase [Candidatus Hodarchaeales archaeon]|jgi:K(+)-stimulated pyrophosphate-energized sodium pump
MALLEIGDWKIADFPDITDLEWAFLALCVLIALLGLAYAVLLVKQVLGADIGEEHEQRISRWINEGANAYLRKQFRAILLLVAVLAIGLWLTADLAEQPTEVSIGRGVAFLVGAAFSGTVGFVGMNVATKANLRVAVAARKQGFGEALKLGYRGGTVTGMLTDGLGLLGGTVIFIIYATDSPHVLLGFGFGGTLLALFQRVGGGIYTKAADVGADLVGKVEADIPEDDPRNAAVIADLVGDNVGDCAGMAADVFESYEVTIVAALILGLELWEKTGDLTWIVFPLIVRAIGVFSSIIGTYFVRGSGNAMRAIEKGFLTSALVSIVGFFFLSVFYFEDLRVGLATLSGILLAIVINRLTEWATGTEHGPVKEIAQSSKTGPATNIISGLASGMEASSYAILIIALSIAASVLTYTLDLGGFFGKELFPTYYIEGTTPREEVSKVTLVLYGVALCGIGMLTLTGNNVAMDSFGPIADNANGIAEMTGYEGESRQILADLDAVGNTTKAITKGIAIGSAVIAAVALFGAFVTDFSIEVVKVVENNPDAKNRIAELFGFDAAADASTWTLNLDIAQPEVFIGILIGGSIPLLFSALSIRAVGRAASGIIQEVRRQFRIPGIMEGTKEPDYARCVTLSTEAAQKELIGLGIIAVLSSIIVAFLPFENPVWVLGGFLAGIIVSGQLQAVFQADAGGAWDNAKKTIEDGIYGPDHSKGSETHKASVVGDTVGDPLKDTSGPALNPMIKVVNMVSLLILPTVIRIMVNEEIGGIFTPFVNMAILVVMLLLVAGVIFYSKKTSFSFAEEITEAETETSKDS